MLCSVLIKVDPSVSTVTTDLPPGNPATVGESFTITYKLSIPAPSQTGAGSSYVFQVLAPFTTEAKFSVCSLQIVSVGKDLPCIKVEDLEPVYLSRSTDAITLPDTATLDIGMFYPNLIAIRQKFYIHSTYIRSEDIA